MSVRFSTGNEKTLQIHVIPHHDPVNYFYGSSKLVTSGERLITDTVDMVEQVVKLSRRQKAKVWHLTITGHGNPKGFYIGNDWVDESTLTSSKGPIVTELKKLKSVFTTNAMVVIRACDTGESKGILRALSSVLGGVTVVASEWKQLGPLTGLSGAIVQCKLTTCGSVSSITHMVNTVKAKQNLPQ
ncbi:MAG: DUF4347 domain-containing protein [Planctomycetes bacterium]|nr:DUF4347 domain-containing protein [Planctomycetota bacterium]